MRWEDERYVRSYTRDTPGWKMLPWQAKALQKLLERKLDRAGVLDLAEYAGEQMNEVIAVMVDLPEEVVGVGLPALLKRKTFERHGQFLVMPNFIDAQEASSSPKARAKAQREKARDLARAQAGGITFRDAAVTKRDASSQNVTQAYEDPENRESASQNVTPGSDPFALPPGETDDDIPDDLGQVPEAAPLVTKRDGSVRNATHPSRNATEPIQNGSARHSVPNRAVPSRAVPADTPHGASLSKKPDEADRIEAEIRRHRVFDSLDARAIAEAHAGRMMTDSQRLDDVLEAISSCAAKSVGLGFTDEALQSKLVGFLWKAGKLHGGVRGAPTSQPTGAAPAAPKEFDFSQYQGLHSGRRQP
jgi:hypothetical protein